MPTFTYEERVLVCRAVDAGGAAKCPRCASAIETSYMPTLQDKMLKRKGKPLYRCTNRACACECTPLSYLTAAPIRPPPSAPTPGVPSSGAPTPGAPTPGTPKPPSTPPPGGPPAGRA
jgi:hypothetical protein